ncbi:MAG: dienelactone hydrolase family protein [Pseudomonadales bacterium]|nr:dienelactone hydrolase family protein [Pseudomonadales bacterium]
MQQRYIDYEHAGQTLQGFLARPDGTDTVPGILIAHAWGGRDEFVLDKARTLAGLGYAAFALDVYGKGILGSGPEQNSQLMTPLLADRALLRDRLAAGLDCLRAQPGIDTGRIAVMGYCFGGLCALDLARSGADIRGAVSLHGLFVPPGLEPRPIKAHILALHGYADPMVPPQQVVEFGQEMSDAGVDWQLHAYGGVLHAFTVPEANDLKLGTLYDARAERRAWRTLLDFYEEIFA